MSAARPHPEIMRLFLNRLMISVLIVSPVIASPPHTSGIKCKVEKVKDTQDSGLGPVNTI
jgi:hypothetical protein